MRFFYIGPFRFPKGDAAAARVLNNARILRELGHHVQILSFGGGMHDDWQEFDGIPYYVTSDMDTHSWKERLLRYTSPYPTCRSMLKQMVNEIDVIICYNLTFSFSQWLLPFCKKHNKKIIVDVTEWYSSVEMPGGRYSPIYWMSEFYMKHTLKKIPNRILISNYLNDYYNYGNNLKVPPLVDIYEAKWSNGLYDYPPVIDGFHGIKVFYSGTPNFKDLLRQLIQATLIILRKSKGIQIIVAGVNEEQGHRFFERESDYFENRQHFIFLGRIPQDIVPRYYNISDFSTVIREPSRKNMAGFPTKMAESMAAGCPVIASDFSDMKDFVEDGKNGIVLQDSSTNTIINGLNRILALSHEQLNEMKIAAKRCGETKFDYRNYISSFDSFIKNIK